MADERRIPEALGKYKVLQRLAVGGMAELFLARVTGIEGFEKYVAIKRILPLYAEDRHFVDMFLDEARLAARLDHQNVVQVHDIGQDEGAYFFVMEYLHGEDAQGLLKAAAKKNQRIPLEQALTIIAGVASGLAYAHEKRDTDGLPLHIVHRDVAPSNIIVTYDGGIKLVDFGIARAHFRRSQTEAGRVKGKLSYMSPEQCRGEDLDARSDIFTLGIVAYELTTMSRLFRARRSNKLEVMQRIVKGDIPPPKTRFPGYPDQLEDIVMRALRISKEQRYQTAAEFLHDLEAFAKQESFGFSSSALARYLRETVGYRLEPWRIDRPYSPEIDTGKVRRADDEAKLSLPVDGHRTPIPTPGRPASVVSGSITVSHTAPGHETMMTPAHFAQRSHRGRAIAVAVVVGVVAVLVILVAVAQLGGRQAEAPTVEEPASSTTELAPAAAAEFPPELLAPAEAVEAEREAAPPVDAGSESRRGKKARRDKKTRQPAGVDMTRSGRKKPGSKSTSARSEPDDSQRTEPDRSADRSAGGDATGDGVDAKRERPATEESPGAPGSRPRDADDAEPGKKTASEPKSEQKERKKWDVNSPFPPSMGGKTDR